jgi:uncharacterized membrane protein
MSAHRVLFDLKNAPYQMTDPGASGTVTVNRQLAVVPVVTATAEARTLAQPTKAGLLCTVLLKTDGGDLTLTVTGGYNQGGDTSITFAEAGDWVTLQSVVSGTSYYWRVLGSEGTTLAGGENALTGVTAGTISANKAVIANADSNIGVVKATALHIGTSGSETQVTATAAELNYCDVTTAGTVQASKAVVADANKDVGDFRNVGMSGVLTNKAGAASAAVAARFGATATEGLEIKVIDETVNLTNAVETNLTETVPAGAVILSVQANLQTTVVGDASGDDGLVKVGIGITSDPDKYGKSADLVKNHKIDTIPDWAVLSGAEIVCVKGCDTSGDGVTEKFVADVPAGTRNQVRVRIVYAVPNSLDDAA